MNYLLRFCSAALPLVIGVLLIGWPPRSAHAAVSCSASMTNVAFGNVDLISNIGLTTTAILTYTCTNSPPVAQALTVCFNIGDPHGAFYGNRWITRPGAGNRRLYFNFYQNSANTIVWGTNFGVGGTVTPPKIPVSILASGTSGPSTLVVYAAVGSDETGTPGNYATAYGTGDTLIAFSIDSDTSCQGNTSGSFPFTVSATVGKSCVVSAGSASNIQIGAASGVAANSGSNSGNGSVSVTCTKMIPYNVGLSPSNANTAGAGVMSGTGFNTDKLPYQLNSVSATGPIWGNTATATAKNNGVAGIGNGESQSIPVFATAPSANYTPDSYTDTVTVTVNY